MWELKVEGAPVEPLLCLDKPVSESVTEAFINTKKVRQGARPSDANVAHLNEMLGGFMLHERPIDVLTMWGAAKAYGQFDIRSADLLDVMALKRLACLQAEVQRFYKPGIAVKVIWEDWTEEALSGFRCQRYHDSLVQLIHTLGVHFVSVVKESTLIRDGDFYHQSCVNAEAIMAGRLADIGWQGAVAWEHYLQRAATEYPDLPEEGRREKVAMYLGITLARYQRRVVPGGHVKLSFVPYPNTVPDAMMRGRVEYKVKTGKNCNCSMPPWCGFGLLKDGGWGPLSVRELRAGQYERGSFHINGYAVPYLRSVAK